MGVELSSVSPHPEKREEDLQVQQILADPCGVLLVRGYCGVLLVRRYCGVLY